MTECEHDFNTQGLCMKCGVRNPKKGIKMGTQECIKSGYLQENKK